MAQVTLDGPTTGYTRKVKIGTETYNFSTRVVYESNISGTNPITGAQVQVPNSGTARITQLYSPKPNVWVTSAELGVDGKWKPLKKSESKDLLGNPYYPSSEGNEYVLGAEALKGLSSYGPNTLNNLSVNDGKVLYKKYTGLSDQQVNTEFNVSSNIAPPGSAPSPSLFGPGSNPGSNPSGPQQQNGPNPEATTIDLDVLTNLQINTENPNPSFEDLVYPTGIRNNDQDFIKFTVIKYIPRKLDLSKGLGILGDRPVASNENLGKGQEIQVKGSVILPIQPSISDSNNVDWNGTGLDPLGMTLTGASLNLASGPNTQQDLTNLLNAAGGTFSDPNVQRAFKLYLAQKAAGVEGLLSRVAGAVVNPNLELLFQGPTLRPFNFTFRLSPRDIDEATKVRKIIRVFKQYSAVGTASNGLFLTTPNVFNIQYVSRGNEQENHKSLNRIKTCALKSVSVDYTPDGSYMTFNDDATTMTSYSLSLQFQELEPVTTKDYNMDYDQIGY